MACTSMIVGLLVCFLLASGFKRSIASVNSDCWLVFWGAATLHTITRIRSALIIGRDYKVSLGSDDCSRFLFGGASGKDAGVIR